MTTRVAINGFGRIGRLFLRAALDNPQLEVVAVNDVAPAQTLARLLRHDSTFGPLHRDVTDTDGYLIVDGHKVAVSAVREPQGLPWRDHDVDLVIESTGKFRDRAGAGGHLQAGARKVIISAPGKNIDATIVLGVNESIYDPATHHIVSNASCTTNCVAPMVKVLHDAFGIERGYMTTIHAYTNDQNVLDGPHKDPRRARAAGVNIIPTTTGAARAVAEVIPDMRGRLDGVAIRVPVVDGSLVDLSVLLTSDADAAAVNAAFAQAAQSGSLAGKLRYSTDPFVSTDVIGDSASCVFDAPLTQVSDRMVTVFGWYDNEWGYTARLIELAELVAAR